jgi:hypothetical protein
MERGIIERDPRDTIRSIRTAMQGNVIRALVELITNSDDSYARLEGEGKNTSGLIEILYRKEGYCGVFEVRDQAEGMAIEDVRNSFKKYGAVTSGLKAGKKVRGFFGHGAKDALAGMGDGRICTFKDDVFIECRIFIEDGKAMYDISSPTKATPQLRAEHGIRENGTVAYFRGDPKKDCKVPRFETVHEEVTNSFLLRKIMSNAKRKILLKNEEGDQRTLRYKFPPGKELLSDTVTVSYKGYGNFDISITVNRAERELTQSGDDRIGGLLLVDEEDVPVGISLFKYDNEPLASKFFGEVKISRFRELLANEEAVLSESREGLISRHEFCRMLILEIEGKLEGLIKAEKEKRDKDEKVKIDIEEAARYKKAFGLLNEIAEVEASSEIYLGPKPSEQVEEPPDGFCLYPATAQVTVGKRYNLELRVSSKIVHVNSLIKISSTAPQIAVSIRELEILPNPEEKIIRKFITIEGKEANIEGLIRAQFSNKTSSSKIYVLPEKELLLSEGIDFQPGSMTLHPNQPRQAHLLVHVKMIENGSSIQLSSDNNAVQISRTEIVVNEFDAVRHIAKYDLDVWGEGEGQDAIITASVGDHIALLEVRIRSKEADEKKGKKGMFTEPSEDEEISPRYRTSFSKETGKVLIYVNFPSIKHYLGEEGKFRKSLPAQVLIADLVAERCFYEIAKRKVENSGVMISPAGLKDKIENEAIKLSQKYGKRVHEALVDQTLLNETKKHFA